MSGYEKRAVCGCGRTFRAAFGSLFHVWEECCPSCGADKSTFDIQIGRFSPHGVWFPKGVEIPPVAVTRVILSEILFFSPIVMFFGLAIYMTWPRP